MKLHLFKQIGDARGSYNAPILHAFTTDKVLAKEFKETRDMENFIHRVIEVDKYEYNQFSKNYPGKVLTRTTLNTKDEDGGLKKVSVTMTFSEEEQSVLRTDSVYEELGKHTMYDVIMLNDDILEALDYIDYFDIMKFYNSIIDEPYNLRIRTANGMADKNTIDELEVFMFFFGYLMNEE